MCPRVSRLNFLFCLNTRESSFKALTNVFEGLYFLSLITANRIKPLRRSEIYQRYRHLNLSLDQTSHLLPQAHHNFEINIMSFVLQSLIFMAPRQQIMMTTKSLDRMRLFQKSDFLITCVSQNNTKNGKTMQIRQRMQNIFKFIFMLVDILYIHYELKRLRCRNGATFRAAQVNTLNEIQCASTCSRHMLS